VDDSDDSGVNVSNCFWYRLTGLKGRKTVVVACW